MAEFRGGPDIKAGRLASVLLDHYRAEPLPIHVVYLHRRHLLPKDRSFVDFLAWRFAPAPPWQTME